MLFYHLDWQSPCADSQMSKISNHWSSTVVSNLQSAMLTKSGKRLVSPWERHFLFSDRPILNALNVRPWTVRVSCLAKPAVGQVPSLAEMACVKAGAGSCFMAVW